MFDVGGNLVGRWKERSDVVKVTGWGQRCGGGVVVHQWGQGSICLGWEGEAVRMDCFPG